MLSQFDGPTRTILAILFFPLFFQEAVFSFVWGSEDILSIALAKRFLLLLPAGAIVAACWLTIPCLLTIVIRHQRRQFITALLVTWYDLGRAIFSFWAGVIRFIWYVVGWLFGFLRLLVFGTWLAIQDIFLSPLRMAKDVSEDYFRPGVPWIAVVLLLFWSLLEAILFTFVTTPLVMDVLAGMAGLELQEFAVQIPLFLMLYLFVLGSYAVLSSLGDAFKEKNTSKIIQIVIFEVFVLGFEVMFLYREFVDALVPWFAQHSGGEFRLGIIGTLSIAAFAWMGIRGMTWFLFAQTGTPTILAIIQRTGLNTKGSDKKSGKGEQAKRFAYIEAAIDYIKRDINWIHEKGDEMLGAFILPPLQIVAATINFFSLLFTSNHLFDLPFKKASDLIYARELISRTKENLKDK